MNGDLGTRLVSAGLVTREELGRALASVPVHGGALLAELVRNGVEEEAIAGFFVADGFGPVVDDEELADAGAAGGVSPQLAVDMLAIPLTENSGALAVAMADPSDAHSLRELAHASGMEIVPRVARVSALLALLTHRYPKETEVAHARRERRPRSSPTLPPQTLADPAPGDGGPGDGAQGAPVPLTRMTRPPRGRQPRQRPRALDGRQERPVTAEFERLPPAPSRPRGGRRRKRTDTAGAFPAPDTRRAGRAARPDTRDSPRSTRGRRITADLDRPGARQTLTPAAPESTEGGRGRDTIPHPAPPPQRPSAEPEPQGRRGRRITAEFGTGGEIHGSLEEALLAGAEAAQGSSGGWGDLSEVSAAEGIARRAARAHAILPSRLPGSGSAHADPAFGGREEDAPDLAPILATLRAAKTRDDVCREACRGLAPLGRCAVLLVLVKGILEGREVAGGDLPKDAVRNIWIPSTSRSLLQRVVETGEPYLGPHGASSADAVFRAALSSRGGDVLLMPVVLSGRTVAVLALDEPSTDGVVLLERAELLTRAMAGAFKRLVMAAKR